LPVEDPRRLNANIVSDQASKVGRSHSLIIVTSHRSWANVAIASRTHGSAALPGRQRRQEGLASGGARVV
jgi:hypothetical protein